MDINDSEYILNNNIPLGEIEEQEIIDLSGYQVTKGEFFAHLREPTVTIWKERIKFNMACIRRFPGITHIQLLVHPEQKRMIIRPCVADTPDSLRWVSGGGEKEIKSKEMTCRVFALKLFDLMKWDGTYRYKLLGKPAVCDKEILFLFKLTDFELYVSNTTNKRRAPYYPEELKDYFGIPVIEHEDAYKIDLADGYITTGGMS
ncbi:MAG: integrase [Oscillospiraceae bacterium]|nr:integrase [Oscillospiraceae bacterium]